MVISASFSIAQTEYPNQPAHWCPSQSHLILINWLFFLTISVGEIMFNHVQSIQFNHFPTPSVGEVMLKSPSVATSQFQSYWCNAPPQKKGWKPVPWFVCPFVARPKSAASMWNATTIPLSWQLETIWGNARRLETTSVKLHLWLIYDQNPHLHTSTLW